MSRPVGQFAVLEILALTLQGFATLGMSYKFLVPQLTALKTVNNKFRLSIAFLKCLCMGIDMTC